ncbi:MAG TPA: ABC transporter substrate-binding protein [Beijerinckiaceae bacterium]|nr:ABC transporter substrate-binding protein [Beijerinckiaceae bacterium]
MRRREVIAALGAAAAWPTRSIAESTRRTVAVLMPYPPTDTEVRERVAAFREELRRLGWPDETLHVEERWATDNLDRIRANAAELVKMRPDVIFFTGGRVVPIIQRETSSIPTVFAGVSDPLGQGLVPSLARPGGNLTGIALPPFSITAKLVEILKQIAPHVTRAALVFNPANPSTVFHRKEFESAAPAFSLMPSVIPIRNAADIGPAFASFAREPDGGLVFPSDLTMLQHREMVTAVAARHRLPAIYSDRVMAVTGGLASYSADRTDMFRQGAVYVSRILRGEPAGELPVQQPAKFEFVINLKAANALGLPPPPSVLVSADEVIE